MGDIIRMKSNVVKFDEWKGYEGVPEHTRGALLRYRDKGYEPGGFLVSVLTNDLFGAVSRADMHNLPAIKDICSWVYMRMPSPAWGSREAMEEWISAGGSEGLQRKSSAQEEENV